MRSLAKIQDRVVAGTAVVVDDPETGIRKFCRKKAPGFWSGGLFRCAPGRAHSLGGGSPLQTRQGELLAYRQGLPLRGGV